MKASELYKIFSLVQAGVKVDAPAEVLKRLKLSPLDRVKLKLGLRKYIGHFINDGWAGKLPFYIARCSFHRIYFIDYPHGWDEHLHCPKCLEEAQSELSTF